MTFDQTFQAYIQMNNGDAEQALVQLSRDLAKTGN